MKLIVDHLTYIYDEDSNDSQKALDDVSLVINEGEFIGIIGHTGSGKSTLVQHFNALLKPTKGTVYYDGEDIFEKDYDKKKIRGAVGLVFQYPEHQLFAETVFYDVCFGPKNIGMDRKTAELKAYEALKMVKLEDDYFYQSPFDLSGGQKRRVAIAGVLAMQPKVLVLDEPTAGLDPRSKEELLELLNRLRKERGITIIMVSHSMEDIAEKVDRVIVLDKGKILYNDIPQKVFSEITKLEEIGLKAPEVSYITNELTNHGYNFTENIVTIEDAKNQILLNLKNNKEMKN